MKHFIIKKLIISTLTICSLLLVGLDVHAADRVRINGSGSALEMLKPIITAYTKAHPGVVIDMEKPLGSSGAVKALLAGFLDIVATSKQLRPEETAKGATLHVYGKTPLVVVTEASVPMSNITTKELEKIYSGSTKFWPNGAHIRTIFRPEADIDTTILKGLSSGMSRAVQVGRSQPGMVVAVTDPESNEKVAKTSGSIGVAALTGILVANPSLNVLSLNGVKGTTKTLASGAYPLAKSIDFVTVPTTSAAAKRFLEFVYSSDGRRIAEKTGALVATGAKQLR